MHGFRNPFEGPRARRLAGELTTLALLLAGSLSCAVPAAAQRVYGLEAQFQGYSFDERLGAAAANLVIFPVAVRQPLGSNLTLDVAGAWAWGQVEKSGNVFSLSGPVDTRIRAAWLATPWAEVSVSANLPTGVTTHDAEEALVASVLATDLLGFREASWGAGAGVTTGLATATRIGGFGVGLGAAYRYSGEFEPFAPALDTTGVPEPATTYRPGDEVRVRLGIDRNIGASGTFTAGATYQSFTEDHIEKGGALNLFQAGERLSFDASYTFRVGREVWTLHAADVWREHGDNTLDVVNAGGEVVGDTVLTTPSQNLLVAGVSGGFSLAGLRFRPAADIRIQDRKLDDSEAGSGWIAGVGFDVPLRIMRRYGLYPRARYNWGAMVDQKGNWGGLWGGEVGVILSWGG